MSEVSLFDLVFEKVINSVDKLFCLFILYLPPDPDPGPKMNSDSCGSGFKSRSLVLELSRTRRHWYLRGVPYV